MEEERSKNCRDAEELDLLFLEVHKYFDDLYKPVRERRNVEGFAGMDISRENEQLTRILDKLNKGLESFRKSPNKEVDAVHIIASIDAVLELLAFMGNSGPVKPEVRANLDEIVYMENGVSAERNTKPDRLIYLLSVAGTSLEACTMNILHTAIFAFNTHISRGIYLLDSSMAKNRKLVGIERIKSINALIEDSGKMPSQVVAGINKIRTAALAISISFMSINSLASLYADHPLTDVSGFVSSLSAPKAGARKLIENLLKMALAAVRMAFLTLVFMRLLDAIKTSNKIDYAYYQRFKLDEIESKKMDLSQIKSLRRLFTQLNAALKRMSRDDEYDPTPFIEKIREALETVAAGKSVRIKDFLKPSRRAVLDDYKQKSAIHRPAKSSSAVRRCTRKRILALSPIGLPSIGRKLSRRERKELYTRNKALRAQIENEDRGPDMDTDLHEAPEDNAEALLFPSGAEASNEREQLIQKIEFNRTLDGLQFRRFLRAMSFKKTEGGKGSHEKYILKVGDGTFVVILSRTFDHFDDNIIKTDLLRKPPFLNPEWVYWKYCEEFGFFEAERNYEKFFGKKFDINDEPLINVG
jgi:hypothetical protein